MKIAIDLDGTAWKHREFFIEFVKAMKKANHNVGILTAHNCNLKIKDLNLWRKRGFPKPDFYICKTEEDKEKYKPLDGNNGLWKADMVDKYNIDFLFDDLDNNNIYVDYFIERHPGKLFRVCNE